MFENKMRLDEIEIISRHSHVTIKLGEIFLNYPTYANEKFIAKSLYVKA